MPDIDYGKLADELLPKKEKAERDCQGYLECYADGKNGTIDDCKPVVIKLLKEIDKLKAGSIEVGVEEIYEELKNWGGNIQSSQSLTSEEMDEFLKDIAQSINNLKEKE